MSPDPFAFATARIHDAAIVTEPFVHFHVPVLFPPGYYRSLRAHWPGPESFTRLSATGRVRSTAYGGAGNDLRMVLPLTAGGLEVLDPTPRAFWEAFRAWILSDALTRALLEKLHRHFPPRRPQPGGGLPVFTEALLTRDLPDYHLGPHTDNPQRLMSMLLYCPADEGLTACGTSLYTPRDGGFRCRGGPHYPFEAFHRTATVPFLPNSALGFVKSDHSFHGVEPVAEATTRRDLILYVMRTSLKWIDEEPVRA